MKTIYYHIIALLLCLALCVGYTYGKIEAHQECIDKDLNNSNYVCE